MRKFAWRAGMRLPYYAALVLLGIAVVTYEHRLQADQVWGVQVSDLTSLQEKQLDAFLNMNNLVTTLSTGLLGALFFLIAGGGKTQFTKRELLPAFLSAFCVGFSLYYGYQAYQDLLLMLENGTFDLGSDVISFDRIAHFDLFVLGVVLFADFAFYELTKVSQNEPQARAANA